MYGASKLAGLLFTRQLAHRLHDTSVTAAAFAPGVVATDVICDHTLYWRIVKSPPARALMSTPDQRAEPLLRLATVAHPLILNGAYLDKSSREAALMTPQARDPRLARLLWERAAELTGAPAVL